NENASSSSLVVIAQRCAAIKCHFSQLVHLPHIPFSWTKVIHQDKWPLLCLRRSMGGCLGTAAAVLLCRCIAAAANFFWEESLAQHAAALLFLTAEHNGSLLQFAVRDGGLDISCDSENMDMSSVFCAWCSLGFILAARCLCTACPFINRDNIAELKSTRVSSVQLPTCQQQPSV
ncbi:PREDICTED: transmembrane protein 178A-like, partial [Apaloderma vittatum]|uniref:transmembrane protein 178A-like n=1 Tax=Apaloderma vittatum TaxID=57397 RepID=UPI0005214400